jgi:thiosulfate/3-mercaptopyruvate sulfurtransferase
VATGGERMVRIRTLSRLVVGLAVIGLAVPAIAQRDSMVVTPAWLAAHLDDPDVVIWQVGDQPSYDAGHIPGARIVTLQQITTPASGEPPLTLEMSSASVLRAQLAALGVSDGSHVVVYYTKESLSGATRAVFTLMYAGVDRVSLLDGGANAWTKAGQQLTTVVPPAKPGTMGDVTVKPLVVDAAFVQSHLKAPGYAVVDARDAAFYEGTSIGGPTDHRVAGHIAGAHSVPFNQTVDAEMHLKSPAELEALFSKAGVKPGDTVVAYCHIGQQATATLFAARSLGHPVLLYDGSFEDWARRGLLIENPSKRDR